MASAILRGLGALRCAFDLYCQHDLVWEGGLQNLQESEAGK